MNYSLTFLPAFNAPQIENYFSHDVESIKEMFTISAEGIQEDLNTISKAFEEKNIDEVKKPFI